MSHLYDQSPLGKGFSGDLFGRLKVSNPLTIFDSTHRYGINGDFDYEIVGSGSTINFIKDQSTVELQIGTEINDYIIKESKRIFPYQPGKSLQVIQSFVLNEKKENLVQRVGYASSENGIMLEVDGNNTNIIKRSSISGITTTIVVPQEKWNKDKFDGTGPSGYILNLNKAQILFTEYEWLGVGSVRVGFAIDGNFITAHQFNHANYIDSVYMTTANLPVRYEIINKGITDSPSKLKQICVSVQSNGGYQKRTKELFVRRETAQTGIGTEYKPIVSFRLAPGREDAIIIPSSFGGFPQTVNINYVVSLIRNPTLIGYGFTDFNDSSNIQYDILSNSMSGGEVIAYQYVSSTNQARGSIFNDQEYNWYLQLGRKINKDSDIYTLAVRTLGGTGSSVGAIGFYDLT